MLVDFPIVFRLLILVWCHCCQRTHYDFSSFIFLRSYLWPRYDLSWSVLIGTWKKRCTQLVLCRFLKSAWAIIKYHWLGSLKNRNLFLIVLEARKSKSKTKVPPNLILWWGLSSWFTGSYRLTVSSYGREGERKEDLWYLFLQGYECHHEDHILLT